MQGQQSWMGILLFDQIGNTLVQVPPRSAFVFKGTLLPPGVSLLVSSTHMSVGNNPTLLQSPDIDIVVVNLVPHTIETIDMQQHFRGTFPIAAF